MFVDREAVGPDGRVTDRPTRDQLVAALANFAEAAAARYGTVSIVASAAGTAAVCTMPSRRVARVIAT